MDHRNPELQNRIAAARRQAEHFRQRTRAALERTWARQALSLVPGAAPGAHAPPGYQVVEEIQRGGQGVVYRAVQESTGRQVAIKVLLSGGFASPHERTRFAREVQILAQLKHPNIVTIHDSGEADSGAFFVMDYIDGRPLDAYIVHSRLPLPQRLRLFSKVCHAVNAAHLRGVLHRDLKPANIRVDAAGEPHILDFGLARHAAYRAPGDSGPALTQTGQFMGTLPWASPEQVRGAGDGLDLRTDVYALGVMLFQILTGAFPYDVSGPLNTVVQNIQHKDPIRPRSLNRALDDEIETLALKALRKEREQRYETAGDLARDIDRYLAGDPIEAKRSSTGYLLRKQLARHKVGVGVAAAFVALVLVGFGVALALWRDADAARKAEAAQGRIARDNAALADSRAEQASAEAARARAISAFLVDMLASANPIEGERSDITVREAIDRAALRLEREPEAQDRDFIAALRRAIGRTYAALGLRDKGVEHLTAAHRLLAELRGPADAETLRCAADLADVYRTMHRTADAETLYQPTLDAARAADPPDTHVIGQCLVGLGNLARDGGRLDDAERFARQSVGLLRSQPDAEPAQLAVALNDLALTLELRNQPDEAMAAMSEAHERFRTLFGEENYSTAAAQENLAGLYAARGDFETSERLFRSALATIERLTGPQHPSVATVRDSLGRMYLRQTRFDAARDQFTQSLAIRRAVLGPQDTLLANSLNNLAIAHFNLGDLDAAADAFDEALRIFQATRGPDHPSLGALINNLAAVQRARGALIEAIEAMRLALSIRQAQFGPDHPSTAEALENLGRALIEVQGFDEADVLIGDALRIRRRTAPSDPTPLGKALSAAALIRLERDELDDAEDLCCQSLNLLSAGGDRGRFYASETLVTLGKIALARGDGAGAAECFSQAIDAAALSLPPAHWQLAALRAHHATALAEMGLYPQAVDEFLAAHERLAAVLGEKHRQTQAVIERLVDVYERWGRLEDAAAWRARQAR